MSWHARLQELGIRLPAVAAPVEVELTVELA